MTVARLHGGEEGASLPRRPRLPCHHRGKAIQGALLDFDDRRFLVGREARLLEQFRHHRPAPGARLKLANGLLRHRFAGLCFLIGDRVVHDEDDRPCALHRADLKELHHVRSSCAHRSA